MFIRQDLRRTQLQLAAAAPILSYVPRQLPRVSGRTVRAVALAAVVANTVIVLTGALVRLTGSGLGCPTWPECGDGRYVVTGSLGVHGIIEFSNRMLTFVLSVVVLAAVLAAVARTPRRRSLLWWSLSLVAGIVAQAVWGGLVVLTSLNPWLVAGHFLLSMAVIAAAYTFFVRSGEGDGPALAGIATPLRALVGLLLAVTAALLALGTVVTGSGPHAGDRTARRTGLDPAVVAQLHADVVMLLIGLTVATCVALAVGGAGRQVVRAALVLLGVELGQGVIGFVQYFTHLPVPLVAAHVLGACLVWLAALRLWLRTRARDATPHPAHEPTAAWELVGH